jgi:hypothetical protein
VGHAAVLAGDEVKVRQTGDEPKRDRDPPGDRPKSAGHETDGGAAERMTEWAGHVD